MPSTPARREERTCGDVFRALAQRGALRLAQQTRGVASDDEQHDGIPWTGGALRT